MCVKVVSRLSIVVRRPAVCLICFTMFRIVCICCVIFEFDNIVSNSCSVLVVSFVFVGVIPCGCPSLCGSGGNCVGSGVFCVGVCVCVFPQAGRVFCLIGISRGAVVVLCVCVSVCLMYLGQCLKLAECSPLQLAHLSGVVLYQDDTLCSPEHRTHFSVFLQYCAR
mgnify:CR=1 FL=1